MIAFKDFAILVGLLLAANQCRLGMLVRAADTYEQQAQQQQQLQQKQQLQKQLDGFQESQLQFAPVGDLFEPGEPGTTRRYSLKDLDLDGSSAAEQRHQQQLRRLLEALAGNQGPIIRSSRNKPSEQPVKVMWNTRPASGARNVWRSTGQSAAPSVGQPVLGIVWQPGSGGASASARLLGARAPSGQQAALSAASGQQLAGQGAFPTRQQSLGSLSLVAGGLPIKVRAGEAEVALHPPMHSRSVNNYDEFKRVEQDSRGWNNLRGLWGKRSAWLLSEEAADEQQ